jgi:uncharacterized protein
VTLTDAGPLVAIIDGDEADHAACVQAVELLELPLVTTWPAFAEAMSLLRDAGGRRGSRALWRLVETGRLVIVELSAAGVARAATLMEQYADRQLDLAGATLLAYAEQHGQRTIFTLDESLRTLLGGVRVEGR